MHGPRGINTGLTANFIEMYDIWEDYFFLEYYLPQLHLSIKANNIPLLKYESLFTETTQAYRKEFSYGVIPRIANKSLGYKTLLSMVSRLSGCFSFISH
jgi:hypothetical protein